MNYDAEAENDMQINSLQKIYDMINSKSQSFKTKHIKNSSISQMWDMSDYLNAIKNSINDESIEKDSFGNLLDTFSLCLSLFNYWV